MSKSNIQLCIQVLLGGFLSTVILLHIILFWLKRKIDNGTLTYNESDLIELHASIQREYNLNTTLIFIEHGVATYNLIEQAIRMVRKVEFFQSDYIIFLHEISHAIDFSRKKTNVMTTLKVVSVIGSLLCYVVAILGLFDIGVTYATILLCIAVCFGLLDIMLTARMERAANKILLDDFIDGRYKLFVRLTETLQTIERVFLFICLLLLFFFVRTNIDALR